MPTTVDEIVRAINEQLRSRKAKIEAGSYNYILLKVVWTKHGAQLLFQCEENCQTDWQPVNGHMPVMYVNGRTQ